MEKKLQEKFNMKGKKSQQLSTELIQVDFGEIFIKREGDRVLEPFSARVTLSASKGELYEISKSWRISADGYLKLNKIASISIISPQVIIVDGVERPNPYIERDRETKAIQTVNIRKVGIGYSPVGNVVAIDNTLFYNVYTYFLQSLQAKAKMNPKCARLGTNNIQPQEAGSWVFFPIEPPVGLWVNLDDKDIVKAFEDHVQRQRFGDRIAQKIVTRNVLRSHPAIGVSQVSVSKKGNDTIALVRVYGYRRSLTTTEIGEIARKVERGEEIEEVEHIEEVAAVDVAEEEKIIEETRKEEEKEEDLFSRRVTNETRNTEKTK
jgi:hypothetical protein